MELRIRGKITAETTKIDREGDRETVWQVHSDLSADEAAELQQVMGRELWMSLETYEVHRARKQERAGQLRLPIDQPITEQPPVTEGGTEEAAPEFPVPAESDANALVGTEPDRLEEAVAGWVLGLALGTQEVGDVDMPPKPEENEGEGEAPSGERDDAA